MENFAFKLCVQKLDAGFKSRTSLKFFRPYFHYCLSSLHCCEDHFHLFNPQFTSMIFIYSQLFIYHFTSLLRITIMTSSQLACWLRLCSTELLLLEVGKENSQIIFAKILYLALSTRFGKYLNIPEIICKQKKTNKQTNTKTTINQQLEDQK